MILKVICYDSNSIYTDTQWDIKETSLEIWNQKTSLFTCNGEERKIREENRKIFIMTASWKVWVRATQILNVARLPNGRWADSFTIEIDHLEFLPLNSTLYILYEIGFRQAHKLRYMREKLSKWCFVESWERAFHLQS